MEVCEFYGISSEFFDEDYAALERSGDVEFYRAMALDSGGPVLEMGCGTGRILLPIARSGLVIHGMDASPGMLLALRRKLTAEPQNVRARVWFTEGDMRTARAPGEFPLVIAPFRVVQHLIRREDQRMWLRNVARHLVPGGSLVFDVFHPDFARLSAPSDEQLEVERTTPEGVRVRRYFRSIPHAASQTIDVHFRWIVDDPAGARLRERCGWFSFRWFTRGELENLLDLEGFDVVDYWGSFQREPFHDASKEQIIRARLRVRGGG